MRVKLGKFKLEEDYKLEIISIYNLKGGVGKTTSTHSLAVALKELGKKVLVIDIDPQSSLTFMITDEKLKATTKDVLLELKNVEDSITKGEQFDYIGSTLELTLSELELNNTYNKESILKNQIERSSIHENYDFCLIDCPPSMGIFTLNALTVSDSLIIPCQCELLSLEGLNVLFQALKVPTKKLNQKLKVKGILPTLLNTRAGISKDAYEMLIENYTDYKIYKPIRVNAKLGELGIDKRTIFEIDKKSNGAKDYMEVAREILNG